MLAAALGVSFAFFRVWRKADAGDAGVRRCCVEEKETFIMETVGEKEFPIRTRQAEKATLGNKVRIAAET